MSRVLKRVLCLVMTVLLVVGTVLPASATELTGANKRINTYINMAKGEELTDKDVSDLTQDELRFMGVYLSNFFIPFKTELGVSGSEKDTILDQNKEQMIKALKTSMSFSDDLAASLVDTILGLSRKSVAQHVNEIGYYVKSGDSYIKLENINVNYLNFFTLATGRADKFIDGLNAFSGSYKNEWGTTGVMAYGDDVNIGSTGWEYIKKLKISKEQYDIVKDLKSSIKDAGTPKYDKVYLGYGGGSGTTIVADFYVTTKNKRLTPFQVAFLKSLEVSDMNMGWGINLLDLTEDELPAADVSTTLPEYWTKWSADTILKSTPMGRQISVDCFGNIVVLGANHQFVAIPGCMNPYTWVKVNNQGIDTGKPGEMLNIINGLFMSQNDEGILQSGVTVSSGDVLSGIVSGAAAATGSTTMTVKIADFSTLVPGGTYGIQSDGGVPLRLVLGNSNANAKDNDGVIRDTMLLPDCRTRDDRPFDSALITYRDKNPNDWSLYEEYGDIQSRLMTWSSVYMFMEKSGKFTDYNTSVKYVDNMVFIDNLGVFEGQESFNALNIAHYMDESGGSEGTSVGTKLGDEEIFRNRFEDQKNGAIFIPDSLSEQALTSVYATYLFSAMYDSGNKADSIGKLGYRMAIDTLPEMPNSPLKLGGDTTDSGLEAIKNWVYYLLHPTEGFTYVVTLITNKLNHFLLKWHYDMTGTNGVGAITGTTTYKGNTGYVSMPDLSEIQWTASLINLYNSAVPVLIVIVIIIMLFAFITGTLKLQQAILGALLFSAFLSLPVTLINGVVDISNRATQLMYADKFTYWALVQQESYASKIDEAANKAGSDGNSTYENYLRTLLAENSEVYSNQGGESILLKWQAPRKFKAVGMSSSDANMLSGLSSTGKSLLMGALNGAYSGQSFTDNDNDVYLYRSYIDSANIARYAFNGIKQGTRKAKAWAGSATDPAYISKTNWPNAGLKANVDHMIDDYALYKAQGFTTGKDIKDTFYATVPIASSIIDDMLKDNKGKLESMGNNISATDTKINETSKVGLDPDLFFFHIPMFNSASYAVSGDDGFKNACATLGIDESSDRALELKSAMSGKTEEDLISLSAFALYSESPFYYFSWKLYSDGLEPSSSLVNGNYKDLVLGENYFYNSNGGINDFMDMRSLFTYIIPYLKQCNDIVREWDDMYGCFLYDGVPTEEGRWGEVKDNPDLAQKYWHNLNVARLYSIYSPWVDILYDCSYAKETQIKAFGKLFTITDPLDPSTYPDERPMIFSEAEMNYMGLSSADLTQVERMIIAANKDMQESSYDLLNYYNFSDVSLNSAAAMNCTFAFNIAFSETGIFSENKILYPQSFDLPSFSYDAFLRLILSNNTGESLLDTTTGAGTAAGNTTGDFYERIVNNSSMTTVIVMLLLDVMSIYVVPMLRIFFVIAIFLASILIVLSQAMRVEGNMKFVTKVVTNFIMPLVKFLAVTVGFAFIVSLFMGVGNNAVTLTTRNSIQMGDPVMAMLLMLVVNVGCIILYWRIISGVLRNLKSDFKNIRAFSSMAVAGTVAMAAAGVAGAVSNTVVRGINGSVDGNGGTPGGGSSPSYDDTADEGNTSRRAQERSANRLDRSQDIAREERMASGNRAPDGGVYGSGYDSEPTNYGHDIQTPGAGSELFGRTENMTTRERQERSQQQQETINDRINSGTEKLNKSSGNPGSGMQGVSDDHKSRRTSYRSTEDINTPRNSGTPGTGTTTNGYSGSENRQAPRQGTYRTSPQFDSGSMRSQRPNRTTQTASYSPLPNNMPNNAPNNVNRQPSMPVTRQGSTPISAPNVNTNTQSRQTPVSRAGNNKPSNNKPLNTPSSTPHHGMDNPNRSTDRAKNKNR